jgi:carotenoid cleavage dioxygenase-like enzyme
MNAYEAGNTVIAHVMQYEVPPLFPALGVSSVDRAKSQAHLYRWTFNLSDNTDEFRRDQIDDLSGDFPRLDERFSLNQYRYGYFAAREELDAQGFDMLVSYDFRTEKRATSGVPKGDAFSEPVFVPRGEEAGEGDGYLLATIYRAEERRSDRAIFDAMTLADGPIAVAELSHRVTLGFHGNWMGGA